MFLWLNNLGFSYPTHNFEKCVAVLRRGSTPSLSHFRERYDAASVAPMWFLIVLSLALIKLNSFKTKNVHNLVTFSSHTEYVKRGSIVIAWVKNKFSPFDECSYFVCLRRLNKPKKIPSVCLSVGTWTFAVGTITFEGISGSKQNLVGVFYVWNVGLVLKSKVKSWSWSWSWTKFWFLQKVCGATPNLVDIFSI